ncbi:hypothetical protein HDIA_1000 [Hartmannibacter diazotrophicus]|uniref:Uncharacterized protein n=1 Tax=Hartmannibacter diazotrophicus TaxID=1482074 RepID=A0A2C9D451_9HYPH|nr:hypothetical protein [Hartmannibacter diazotrophicus]SON54541.1 hypothetical protein HDIA_1000 [Hartmannibacter diazotrophicus]
MIATQSSDTTKTPAVAPQGNPVNAILRRLATRVMGMTGADIERIVGEARLKARRGTWSEMEIGGSANS